MHYDPDGNPITLQEWRRLFETIDRDVSTTELTIRGQDVAIGTTWLGLNHNFLDPEGPPLIFETMVWGGPLDGSIRHYATREEALAGHREVVKQHRFWRVLRMRKKLGVVNSAVAMTRHWLTRPESAKMNRVFLWVWVFATLLALSTVVGNILYGYRWFLLPFHIGTLLLDTTALRWTIQGYRWKRGQLRIERARIREQQEFQRIMETEYRKDSDR